MNKENAKKLLKFAALIYLASFLAINWNDVSWIFNYKAVNSLVDDFFNPYPSINASAMDVYFYPNHSQNGNQPVKQEIKDIKTTYTSKQNTLEIPKISIEVPIIFSASQAKESLIKDLNSGVIFYPGSVYPGQAGQMIILGHSAPVGWPKIKYDWAFSDLDKLLPGDAILIDLNNKQYTYIVKQTTIIKKGADVPQDSALANKNILILISCWPPGKDYQRIAVIAEMF